ncbi:MAG: carbonic anhydrase [bacterium]
MTGREALEKLLEGNRRYLEGGGARAVGQADRESLVDSQSPMAAILCCSDSRVPPEHVFDAGLGEIFIVRVAGHVVGTSVLGSLEYAVDHLDVPLILVLGHESCGAVKAALAGGEVHGSIKRLVERIKPSLKDINTRTEISREIMEAAVTENVRFTQHQLQGLSDSIRKKVEAGDLMVTGAVYSLRSGEVNTV